MGLFDFLFKRKKEAPRAEANTAKTEQAPSQKSVQQHTEKISETTVQKKENVVTPVKKKEDDVLTSDIAADKIASDASSETVKEVRSARNGKFEIKKAKDGRYVFNLYASNHVIVATSQVYSSSQGAMNGIKSVIANADKAGVEDQTRHGFTPLPYPKWEMYIDKGGQYRFRLLATNGSCICHSQGYTSKANCKKGIESIIKFAADAEITKAYLKKED